MFKSLIKVLLRKTSKQIGFFTFQLAGLVTGISVFLIVFSFYQFENSFDTHITDYDRIYRIEKTERNGDNVLLTTSSSRLIPELAKTEIPEIEEAIGIINGSFDITEVSYPIDKQWSWLRNHRVSKDFFKIFDFKVLEGNKETLFEDINSVVLSQSMAEKIFGEISPIGKTIFIWGRPRPITGVVQDPPKNSHIQFDFLTSMERYFSNPRWDTERIRTSWSYLNSVMNYVKISENSDPKEVENKINEIYTRFVENDAPERYYSLVPINDIHLYSKAHRQLTKSGNAAFVEIVFWAGIIIAFLTIVNFIKISLANVTQRAKETGVRKALGGSNHNMAITVIGENGIVMFIAIALAFGIVNLLGALESDILPIEIYPEFLSSNSTLAMLGLLLVIGSLFPSIAPINLLSKLNLTTALRGNITSSSHNFGLLRGLMSFQVLFSLILISSALFFKDQINFILTRDSGFDKEKLLYMELHAQNADFQPLESFKEFLATIPGVNSVTNSIQIPMKWAGSQNYALREQSQDEPIMVSRSGVSHDFFKTLGVELVEGREFSKNFNDSSSCILNESAVKSMGLTNPIGKRVLYERPHRRTEEKIVVGVVKDFNFRSMHSPLLPAQFIWIPRGPTISLNFNSERASAIINEIELNWDNFNIEGDFNYTFMDDYVASQHKEDILLESTIGFLSYIIIFLASLGIYGISAFIGQKKQKEIAIRKVLGSSAFKAFWLLTNKYIAVVCLALLVAIYPVYYLVTEWLKNFAYTTDLNWSNFGYALIIVSSIVLAVTGINTFKAALTNPVNTLNKE